MPNYNWFEPETNLPFTYSNEFGELTLEPVTDFMPVKDISRDKLSVINDVLVSLDIAEQTALITGLHRVSIEICLPLLQEEQSTYAVKYSSCNRAAVCKITIKRFTTPGNISAKEQIKFMAPKTIGPLALN